MTLFEEKIAELKEENLSKSRDIETGVTVNTVKSEPEPMNYPAEVPAAEMQIQTLPHIEADIYSRRAADEVAFLQIIEHIFAGVEREQLKIVPKPYDDLKVKKILHNFLQLSPDINSVERTKAELLLQHETECWHWSLSLRDERMMAGHLRRFCETSSPPLSSLAQVTLARFYRTSPYSEPVRNKFDLIVTRLFSKEYGKNQRELVFSREELVTHLTELYAEWSSVSVSQTEAEKLEILEIARKFESYAEYADNAIDFDDLIKSDFFTRLHTFKKSTEENFYAPLITAIGIESNIRIGNRYVELLEEEKQRNKVETLEDRYGFTHDNAISEATAKTYSIIELLKQKKPEPPVEEQIESESGTEKISTVNGKSKQNSITKLNKWLIGATALAILLTGGIYFETKSSLVETRNAAINPAIDPNNSTFKEYLLEARAENETLFGIVSPTWNQLTEEKRKAALKQILSFGSQKGYKTVQLENKNGKTIGIADAGNILVLD